VSNRRASPTFTPEQTADAGDIATPRLFGVLFKPVLLQDFRPIKILEIP